MKVIPSWVPQGFAVKKDIVSRDVTLIHQFLSFGFFYSSTEYSKESLVDYCTGHLKNSSSMECKSISCAGMTSQGLSLIATCNKKDVPDLWSARRIWVSAVSRFRSPYPTLYLGHVIYS